jgi:hypothetical protein
VESTTFETTSTFERDLRVWETRARLEFSTRSHSHSLCAVSPRQTALCHCHSAAVIISARSRLPCLRLLGFGLAPRFFVLGVFFCFSSGVLFVCRHSQLLSLIHRFFFQIELIPSELVCTPRCSLLFPTVPLYIFPKSLYSS